MEIWLSVSVLNAPNYKKVLDGEMTGEEFKRLRIPGQVDYQWVDEKINKPGWAFKISESEVNPAELDFQWKGEWYRPSDLFRVKVIGEFPKESDEQLIPLGWIEAAQERYLLQQEQGWRIPDTLRLGVDVAGMGRDMTIFCSRKGNVVFPFDVTSIEYKFHSNGKIIIEPKDEIIKRIGRSPDRADALANTFYPNIDNSREEDLTGVFF